MNDSGRGGCRTLVVRVQGRACALPLVNVIETMRPLPIEPMAGVPAFVCGISLVRGAPTPVVDLGALLGTLNGTRTRFVTVRLGDRQVALSVSEVVGIRELDASTLQKLPPLVQRASGDVIEQIGALDAQVLAVLRAGWELPEEVWQALTPGEVA